MRGFFDVRNRLGIEMKFRVLQGDFCRSAGRHEKPAEPLFCGRFGGEAGI
jgi:hypothetical protein